MNIEDGTYAARPTAVSVTESKNGNLMAVIRFKVQDGPELTFWSVLAMADGTVNTRNVDDLKKWSGWDGADPYWLMEADLAGTDVEIVVRNEPSLTDPSKTWPTVKWVNPPGGGGGGLPGPADRQTVANKWGAKFRALAGGVPAARRAAAAPAAAPTAAPTASQRSVPPVASRPVEQDLPKRPTPPTAPPPPPVPQKPKPAQATQASAWAKLIAAAENLPQDQKEALWFGFVDATGSDQADMTPEGWAQVEAAIAAHFAGAPTAEAEERLPF
jgi:hypothetical protein